MWPHRALPSTMEGREPSKSQTRLQLTDTQLHPVSLGYKHSERIKCDSVHQWRNSPTNTAARLAASIRTFSSIHITVNGRMTVQARYSGKYSGMFQWETGWQGICNLQSLCCVGFDAKKAEELQRGVRISGNAMRHTGNERSTCWRCSQTVLEG